MKKYYCKGCGEELRMINPTYLICDNPACERWDLPTMVSEAVTLRDGRREGE